MKKKRGRPAAPGVLPGIGDELLPTTGIDGQAPAIAKKEPPPGLLAVPVTTDGQIAWSNLGNIKRERLQGIVSDPRFAREFNLAPVSTLDGARPGARPFSPDVCGVFYDTFSNLLYGLLRLRGMPDIVAQQIRFTEADKELLAEPTSKILTKYVGSFKYEDELILAVALSTVVFSKFSAMQAVAQQLAAANVTPSRPVAVPSPVVVPDAVSVS